MSTKICKNCKKELELSFFNRHALTKDGYLGHCKECDYIKRKKKQKKEVNIVEEKSCCICKEVKSSNYFMRVNRNFDGLSAICLTCWDLHQVTEKSKIDRNYPRKLRLQYDPEYRKYINLLKSKSNGTHLGRRKRMLANAKKRAKKLNLDFNLTLEDIIIPDECPIFKIPFTFVAETSYQDNCSLDRIDNTKGYIKGNVQVISMKANTMKNSATPEELLNFCKYFLQQLEK
jgi:hypothetical protein